MSKYLVFVIAFSVLVFNNIRLVQCADECKTHADCKRGYISFGKFCCRGLLIGFGSKDRACTYDSCLNHYCSTDSDCGDPSMCCRSNKCVNKGCSGCTKNTDCYSSYVCCKKTFLLKQTVCAVDCIKQTCNSNDDCAGEGECCRSGKCVETGCSDKCTSNSECNLGQYCCKNKKTSWGDGCSESCVGEICSIGEDCGGARNECCISNKCVDRGCSGCTTNSNCSTGQHCCKKRQWYELSECNADCIGKSCNTSKDCGGPGETCGSDHRCAIIRKSNTMNTLLTESSNSPPSWMIAVTTVSIVLFLIAVGILLAVFWYMKRKRPANGTVPLVNTQYQGAEIQNRQPNTQFSDLNNPTQHQGSTFQNQPHHTNNNVAHQSHNPGYYPQVPQQFQNGAQGTPNRERNPAKLPQQGNGNQGLYHNYDVQGNQTAMSSYPNQPNNEVRQYHNQLHNPVYHTLESPDVAQDAQYQDSSGQQMYPQNAPYHNPPYNPLYQGNH